MSERVTIAQKIVKDTPLDKRYDAFISILARMHGWVEINTRLRSDRALQTAFGRNACAEQSVVQATFNACRPEQVSQNDTTCLGCRQNMFRSLLAIRLNLKVNIVLLTSE